MSSNNKEYPNDGLSSYSDIRLAYYIYTWDNNNKLKQKTAWSTIGTYSINSNNDIIYTSNKNQLLKTNGSNGVSIVKDTYGVIVNDNDDVAPTILKINGTYIVGLDNIGGTASPSLHTTIPTIDSHLLSRTNGIDDNNFVLSYSNMWDIVTVTSNKNTTSSNYYPFIPYNKGTVIEPVELAVIGKETNGINGITNKGFIYNNYTYKRNVNLINYYNELYNYFKDWRIGSNTLSIDFSTNKYDYKEDNNSLAVTTVSDFDISVIRNFSNNFKQLYIDNSNISGITEEKYTALSNTYILLSTTVDVINELLKNNSVDPSSSLLQAPITPNLISNAKNIMSTWKIVSNMKELWDDRTTAIVMEKLTANSELFDFTSKPNATSIIGMNNRTSQWVELQLPIYDQTYEFVMQDVIKSNENKSGTYSLASLPQFINQYTIIYKYADSDTDKNEFIKTSTINISYSNEIVDKPFNEIALFDYISNTKTFVWTSYSYFLQDHNFNNSASTFRFIGIDSSGGKFKNDQGSNSIKLTGFNKILLNDLYENPNTYQNATIEYYYSKDNENFSTFDINKISGNITSYQVSLYSAIKSDQNVLIGGCGSDGSGHTTGSPGFFYIPLPSDIDMNDNSAYVDTHWMLTTWTPNISKNATDRGIINNKDVLYKYTKMNDIITTGLYGGFTPYYNPNNKNTAGIIRIPQISYGESDYGSPIYVTSCENKIAKLSMIMYTSNATKTVDLPDDNDDRRIKLYNYQSDKENTYILLQTATPTPIGNIPPGDTAFKTYFDNYKQFAACVFTLNSNEKNIILNNNLMNNNNNTNENVAYLDLIGYPDEEFDNLSFDVERKYIFTFNAHIQVTNLNLMSDQINYGTPSLLLVGHFRNRYCKANIPVKISDDVTTNIIYSGRDIFIPLLNKPLENPVNNIYNVEGTYILSWNTTGDSVNEFNDISKYEMYIPKNAKTYQVPKDSSLKAVYTELFGVNNDITDSNNISSEDLEGNILHFENVLDRIYAFILTGETVNNNFMYQFVNNTTYQNNSNKILSSDDINLITGRINGSPIFNTTTTEYNTSSNFNIIINSNGNSIETITCTLVGGLFSSESNKIVLSNSSNVTDVIVQLYNDKNTIVLKLANKGSNVSPLVGIEITVNLIKDTDGNIKSIECYDNHLSFDPSSGIDSGILGINEPMLSMTIQRY